MHGNNLFLSNNHPIRTLILSYVVWKALLLLIAASSPGLGYDTSTNIFLPGPHSPEHQQGRLPAAVLYLIERLTRWDAIYFVKTANRGYVFEQEWAFGWGFTRIIAFCTRALGITTIPHSEALEALVAICIAHTAHFLSVLVLFPLSLAVFPGIHPRFALVTAFLHIISPAGLFLSAPFAESSCALLTFSGILLFAKSFPSKGRPTAGQDLLVLTSGILFGIATTFRSNGILTGLLLLEEAFRTLIYLRNGFDVTTLRRLLATGLGGVSVGVGFLLPQYIAYSEYCGHSNARISRPWCDRTFPSIYTFVQGHYWNVGLFRYWTLANIPLFLLAIPMTAILIASAVWALKHKSNEERGPSPQQFKKLSKKGPRRFPILRNLAVSQLMLTLLTLTTAHVQIVTRISSAYPVWHWYLAASFREGSNSLAKNHVRFMVIYAIVQAGLFASFLPPA